jgi:hypothetical protein
VLLAVLMIEAGGGLSLALGMALSAPPASRTDAQSGARCSAPKHPRTLQPNAPNARAHAPIEHPNTLDRTPAHHQQFTVRPSSGVVEWLVQQGGRAETSRRRLAAVLGRSPTAVHDELHRLAASGAINLSIGPHGSYILIAASAHRQYSKLSDRWNQQCAPSQKSRQRLAALLHADTTVNAFAFSAIGNDRILRRDSFAERASSDPRWASNRISVEFMRELADVGGRNRSIRSSQSGGPVRQAKRTINHGRPRGLGSTRPRGDTGVASDLRIGFLRDFLRGGGLKFS